MEFELVRDHIPKVFFWKQNEFAGNRHMLFTSANQLRLIAQVKCWYIGGTFKIVYEPLKQVWSIHAFTQQEDHTKQVPLVFCLISCKEKKDYIKGV
jgi:hypothetical protein